MAVNKRYLYIFNPDCELSIAHGGRFYTPSSNVVRMAEDLAFLPAFLGNTRDYVLVKKLPDEEFKASVCRALNLKCKAVKESDIEISKDLRGEPWGLGPKVCHQLALWGLGEEWKPEQKEWYSRKTAREGLCRLVDVLPFVESDILPQICYSVQEIERAISEERFLVKAPWSSSGKGLLALESTVGVKEKEWISGMLRRQGYLMLEKRLDKVEDFAMEFYAGKQGIGFIGWSAFTTGDHGEYKGNYIGPQEKIEQALKKQVGEESIELLKQELPRMLDRIFPFYQGHLGVDMMLYKNQDGVLCIQPCVEINLRYNMGIVALFFHRNFVTDGSEGEFSIRFFPGRGEALQEHLRLQKERPAIFKNNRIASGYLNLTPVTEATHFVASVICG